MKHDAKVRMSELKLRRSNRFVTSESRRVDKKARLTCLQIDIMVEKVPLDNWITSCTDTKRKGRRKRCPGNIQGGGENIDCYGFVLAVPIRLEF